MDTETVRTSQRLRPLPLSDNDRAQIGHDTTRTSFLQRMPGIPRGHRLYLPLMPLANADVQRVLYIDLSKKVDTLETERRVLSGNVHVVSHAQLPEGVAFPRKLPFIIGGVLFAAGASLGTTLLLDRGDKTVRSRRNLQFAAGVPVLGYIPALRRTQLASCREVLVPSGLQEAIRKLYANCVLMRDTGRPQSVLVSSALPRDGKTFVTLALAQFAAASGQRVLAIEGDLRRPWFDFRILVLTPWRIFTSPNAF
jgi:succinoglycan biosynthesis transport protein ExoP